MPELPDVLLYMKALEPRIVGQAVGRVRVVSPFVLRTFEPPVEAMEGRRVRSLRRLGKRIVLALDDELFAVIHLMIAGRFRWSDKPAAKLPGKITLAAFDFEHGTLLLTEASPKKRASLHVVQGEASLAAHQPGGLEPLEATLESFAAALKQGNHTLKRALTNPRLFSGIGNAYSDEILHAAGLSPVKLTQSLSDGESHRLFYARRGILTQWIDKLAADFGDRFPGAGEVTAFRPEFAVHGRFGQPCPVCGTSVQRIRYAENETNYCPRCQTGGKLLADRSLSRLLKKDWPRTIDAWEQG